MESGEYAIKKNPNLTYISKAVGKSGNIRYISKVFDLKEFKDFYFDKKNKKIFEVIRESSVQEITAIYNQETTGFSVRIQRFDKTNGKPLNQSFNFHGGALTRFIKFLESLDLLDLSSKENLKFTDVKIDEQIEKKKAFSKLINGSTSLSSEQLFQIFNSLDKTGKIKIFEKFIQNIDDYESENLDAAIKQKEYKKAIKNLETLLELSGRSDFIELVGTDENLKNYRANQQEKIFHNWIESNLWIFGVEYFKKYPFRKIAEDDSQADIILETADGFLNMLEVKRPDTDALFRYDNSHRCYFPSAHFSEAIGQCLIYLQRIEDYKKALEKEQSVRILRPRIRLVIGRTKDFNQEQIDALHFLNCSLHNIDIVTYDHLLENGNKIISFYQKNV